MFIDDDFYNLTESEKPKMISNPGSAYLKIMQYYSEEKSLYNTPNSIEKWEIFSNRFFSNNITLFIEFYDKGNLFYEISKDNLNNFRI